MRILFITIFGFVTLLGWSQDSTMADNVLRFEEYMAYVKQHHPLVKQAELQLSEGEAALLRARGGFDPKIEADLDRKKFKGTEYYNELNATFKIPTWYGIEFKANFEENSGDFLNPDLTVPDGGLYSAGVSFSVAQGFWINERMATLRKARFFREQSRADRDLLINAILSEASRAYFTWLEASNEQAIYTRFLRNAEIRFDGVKQGVIAGEQAPIDSVEARIAVQNRKLSLEAARLKQRKAALELSNFLWLNDVPMEVQEGVIPGIPSSDGVRASLMITDTLQTEAWQVHPKLRSLDFKIKGLTVDRSLKRNKLLPRLDVQYNFLSTEVTPLTSFNTANYKAFVNFSLPLFLRKERGDLKLANIKLQDANLDLMSSSLAIRNKIDAAGIEIASLEEQNELVRAIVQDYEQLVQAEERKFFLGESSLFLINSRERSLIDAQLKENKLNVDSFNAIVKLFQAMGLAPEAGS